MGRSPRAAQLRATRGSGRTSTSRRSTGRRASTWTSSPRTPTPPSPGPVSSAPTSSPSMTAGGPSALRVACPSACVAAGDHDPPEPVTWPDGLRTRMVQVCIDSPRDVHDAEVAFWRALLGERWAPLDGAPVRRQVARRRRARPSSCSSSGSTRRPGRCARTSTWAPTTWTPTYAGCSPSAPVTSAAAGGWHALRDPAGLAFCTTGNDPDQTDATSVTSDDRRQPLPRTRRAAGPVPRATCTRRRRRSPSDPASRAAGWAATPTTRSCGC